ncbi:cilia- and flagella-associated protein 251-like [Olea europaea var. sylvestris]|uniref:cilia- and flagella-associated protein 251-like n=1 Tax=Olea europaea var. sylvestris TaxID=158386 RepID=UPI000C1D734F|nr:cilia- and flagella-associated protein 251-like [Olea europaea var. sylvestris]
MEYQKLRKMMSKFKKIILSRKIGDSLPPTLEIEEPSSLLIKDDEENKELKEENEAEATKEEKEEKKLKNLVMEDSEGDGGGGNCNVDDVENELLFGEPKQEEEEEVVDECPCEEEEKKLTNLVMEKLEGDGPGDGGGGENCNLQDENDLEIGLLFDEVEEDDDDEEEEEESMETLSTDELNNKFEDFIRRMKEDIRMGRNNYNDQENYNYDINLYDKNWPIIIEEEEEVVDECPCEEEEKKLTNLVMEELEGDGPGDGGGGENCNLQDENDLEIGLLFDEVEEDNDDEEEEESMETLSTDELNNKFEDFIRRMKEDIRMGTGYGIDRYGKKKKGEKRKEKLSGANRSLKITAQNSGTKMFDGSQISLLVFWLEVLVTSEVFMVVVAVDDGDVLALVSWRSWWFLVVVEVDLVSTIFVSGAVVVVLETAAMG